MPANEGGGGTPNLWLELSLSTGVFPGRGGGGGPGFGPAPGEGTGFRTGSRANLPASAKGGGALNRGFGGSGGVASRAGDSASASVLFDRLGAGGGGGALEELAGDAEGGGGGGGGARRESAPLVTAGEAGAAGAAGAAGGAGGGGGGGECLTVSLAPFCCCSLRKSTMNSWLSLMKSSVKPLSFRSCPKRSRHWGSKASSRANSEAVPNSTLRLSEDVDVNCGGGSATFVEE